MTSSLFLKKITKSKTFLGSIFAKKLCEFLQSLLCRAVYFPVTSSTLNSASLMPQTDADGVRLVGGPLQIANNSHLLVNSTIV